MESQKSIAVAAVAQMMSLMQDELAFNNSSNLMEIYPEDESWQLNGESNGRLGLEEYGEEGNYSVNTSILIPDPSGSVPTPPDDTYVPYSMRPETYIIPVLFFIIFIIGVIGNGTLIVIFLKHRSMRNVPNMYICSLAVGDILVIFFCVPFTSTVYTVESWPYGVVVCKFSEFIKDLSIGVSVFTLTALSADRYFAIVDPMRKLTGRRATRITCITIVGIWLVSILFALPSLMFSFVWTIEVENSNHTFDVCYPFPKELDAYGYPKVVVMFKFLVYYAIPLCFIATFYIIMAHHLLQSTRNMVGEAQGQLKQIQSRKKVAKMVLSFVVIFALCFFPSHVFLIWFYYYPDAEKDYNLLWHWIRVVGFCLSFINSCINPITLYCVSGTFRKVFDFYQDRKTVTYTSTRFTPPVPFNDHFNRHLLCCCCREDRRSRHHHPKHFLRSGYHSGVSHTDHIYADRIMTNGGTLLTRASTMNKGMIVGGNRSRQNSLLPPPLPQLGNNNGLSRAQQSPSPNGNGKICTGNKFDGGGGGGGDEFEMTTRKSSKKQKTLSCVEETDKFELIRSQQHSATAGNGACGEGDEGERALLADSGGCGGNDIHNHNPDISTSCM